MDVFFCGEHSRRRRLPQLLFSSSPFVRAPFVTFSSTHAFAFLENCKVITFFPLTDTF